MSDLLAAFSGARNSGGGWTAKCPAHDDHRASLSIAHGDDGRWLVKCHAGCELDAILGSVNLERRDLFPTTGTRQPAEVVEEYPYTDEQGEVLFQVVRLEPKDFRQRRPNGRGGWDWGVAGVRRVLYRLHTIQRQKTVFLVEGEKDVHRLADLGLAATTNAGGAGKWRDAYTEQLTVAGVQQVVVVPDNDAVGITHARAVAACCHAAGIKTKLLTLPVAAKADVSDYLTDHGKDDLFALVTAAPLFAPQAADIVPSATKFPVLTQLSSVQPVPIAWLWELRLALGKYTLLAGDPGHGKTTIALDLAARFSTGRDMPDGSAGQLGNSLILTAEDGIADTIRPRVDALGGDPSRVFVLEAVRDKQGSRPLNLARDIDVLTVAIAEVEPLLVIIDPISAYLGKTDSYRDSEVRGLLAPLVKLLEERQTALLAIAHLTKDQQRAALHRPGGSVAFVAAARLVFAVAADPDDDDRRILAPLKTNLCAKPPSLAYRLADGGLEWESGPALDLDAETILSAPSHDDRREQADAVEFLREVLGDGPSRATDVLKAARTQGISDRSVRRAKSRLGVRSSRQGFGTNAYWLWILEDCLPQTRGNLRDEIRENPNKTTKVAEGGHPHNLATFGQPSWPSSLPKDATKVANLNDVAAFVSPPGNIDENAPSAAKVATLVGMAAFDAEPTSPEPDEEEL